MKGRGLLMGFDGIGRAWLCVVLVCLGSGSAWAWDATLGEERFAESGFGLSLRPPAAGELDRVPGDGAIAAWRLDERTTMRLRIEKSSLAYGSLDVFLAQTWKDALFGLTQAKPVQILPTERKIGERPGLVQFAELAMEPPSYLPERARADFDTRPLFFGQAAMQLGPFTIAIVELFAPLEDSDRAERLIMAVADSVEVVTPEALYELRKAQFTASAAWIESFSPREVAESRPTDSWFAVVKAGEPIGFARERWRTEPEAVRRLGFALKDAGIGHSLYTQVHRERTRLLTQQDSYLSDRGDNELWSLVSDLTVSRANGGGIFADQEQSTRWSETGLRDEWSLTLTYNQPPSDETVREVLRAERERAAQGLGDVIDDEVLFSREEAYLDVPTRLPPSQIDGAEAVPPSSVYLSQASLALMPYALPKDAAGAFAFYAFDSASGRLAMRTYRVQPEARGGVSVLEQATPSSPPRVYVFDRRGTLQEIRQPGGLRMVPASRAELSRRWPELR